MGLIAADDMSLREQARLYEFTKSVTTLAFHTGYITQRWSPSDATLCRLRGYYEAGLTADEAADGLFAVHH
jgi:hypothetical protein